MKSTFTLIPITLLLGLLLGRSTYTPHSGTSAVVELACLDTLNVTVNQDCQFLLTPAAVLSGSAANNCYSEDNVQITVEDSRPDNGATVDGCGLFRYRVEVLKPDACPDFQGCWGIVRAEDKTPPVIDGPEDIDLSLSCRSLDTVLNNPASLSFTGAAFVSDNCQEGILDSPQFEDVILHNACDSIVIERRFAVRDGKDNPAAFRQKIRLIRPAIDSIELNPDFKLDAGCDNNPSLPQDSLGNIHPSISGYPYFRNAFGDTMLLDEETCGLAVRYTDERFDLCASAYNA